MYQSFRLFSNHFRQFVLTENLCSLVALLESNWKQSSIEMRQNSDQETTYCMNQTLGYRSERNKNKCFHLSWLSSNQYFEKTLNCVNGPTSPERF